METTISDNNNSITERSYMRNKKNANANSLFSLSSSATSSLIETNDLNQNEDDANNNHDVDLFPTSSTISPRLTMQYSHQPQQQ